MCSNLVFYVRSADIYKGARCSCERLFHIFGGAHRKGTERSRQFGYAGRAGDDRKKGRAGRGEKKWSGGSSSAG